MSKPLLVQYLVFLSLCCGILACNTIFELDRLNLVATTSLDSVRFSSLETPITCSAWVGGQILDISNIRDEEMIQHGHCWSKQPNPNINDNCTRLGSTNTLDQFTSEIPNLEFDSTYFVRTYIQSNTQIIYGIEFAFEAVPENIPLPRIESVSIDAIEQDSATAKSNLVSLGVRNIIDHGHCWSTQPLPTIDLNEGLNSLGSISQTGEFISGLKDLNLATEYYVRPFTIDAKNVIVYGIEQRFTTPN